MLSLALVAASLALAASPDGGAAPGTFQWTIPRVLEVLDVPGETWAEGIPVRIHAVRSAERPEQILKDFLAAARAQGLHVPPPEALPPTESKAKLTAYDPRTGIAHTVLLQPEGDSCAVLLADADMSRWQPAGGEAFAPLPPGASAPLVTRAEGFETMSFELPTTGADPLAFYRSELPRAGFQQVEADLFRGGGVELRVRVTEPRKGGGARSVILLRQRYAADPLESFLRGD